MYKKLLYAISEGQGSFDLSWVSPKLTNWPVYITSHHHNVRVNSLQANFWHWEVVAILFCCSNNMASFWKNPSRLVSIFSWMMLSDWILSRDWWYGPHCLGHKNYPVKFQPFWLVFCKCPWMCEVLFRSVTANMIRESFEGWGNLRISIRLLNAL